MAFHRGKFVWYDLMTSDMEAAETFYTGAVGWGARDSGMPGMTYTLLTAGDAQVGGMMPTPETAVRMGPVWTGYVLVDDVDEGAAHVASAGGAVHRAPADIPGIGRFALVADPQGAGIILFKGMGSPPANPPAPGAPGTFGWHELHTTDIDAAMAFYAGLFGWEKGEAIDMGAMGTYQIFNHNGHMAGGMFADTAPLSRPYWLYYVNVADIDAALARVTDAGGTLLHGPAQVPGGAWIIQIRDPQGALFAMVGPRG